MLINDQSSNLNFRSPDEQRSKRKQETDSGTDEKMQRLLEGVGHQPQKIEFTKSKNVVQISRNQALEDDPNFFHKTVSKLVKLRECEFIEFEGVGTFERLKLQRALEANFPIQLKNLPQFIKKFDQIYSSITEMQKAILADRIDIVSARIGIDPLDEKNSIGMTALHYAAMSGNVEIGRLLVQAGADLEARDSMGRTAVYHAAENGNIAFLRLLIAQGAVVTQTAFVETTPLHAAASHSSAPHANVEEIIEELVKAGGQVDAVELLQRTPLYEAIDSGDVAAVFALLKAGASVAITDFENQTPLDYAKEKMKTDVRQKLIVDLLSVAAEGDAQSLLFLKAKRVKNYKKIFDKYVDQSPQLRNLSKDYFLQNLLRHSWKIDFNEKAFTVYTLGADTIKNLEMPVGGFAPFFLSKMVKGLERYRALFPDVPEATFTHIVEAAKNASVPEQNPQEVLKCWRANKPVMLQTGYQTHSAMVLIWKNYFIICDRGGMSTKSLSIFEFSPELLTEEIIRDIQHQGHLTPETYIDLFAKKLPQQLRFAQSKIIQHLEAVSALSMQIAPNCAWESPETAIYFSLLLETAMRLDLLNKSDKANQEKVTALTTKFKYDFNNWLIALQLDHLDRYLTKMADPTWTNYPDYDLLNRIMALGSSRNNLHPDLKKRFEELQTRYLSMPKVELTKDQSLEKLYLDMDRLLELDFGLIEQLNRLEGWGLESESGRLPL